MAKVGRGTRGCVVEGCERAVKPGWVVCLTHSRTREGGQAAAAARGVARVMAVEAERPRDVAVAGTEDRAAALAAEFGRRMARGDYGALLDERFRDVMEQASRVQGLREELGAGRIVLMRLLAEEEDLGKLALGVARIISANARVERARFAMGMDEGNGLTKAINDFMANLDGDEASWEEAKDARRRERERERAERTRVWEIEEGEGDETERSEGVDG